MSESLWIILLLLAQLAPLLPVLLMTLAVLPIALIEYQSDQNQEKCLNLSMLGLLVVFFQKLVLGSLMAP